MLQNEDSSKLQVFLGRLSGNVSMFGMHFASLKYEMLLQDLISLKPNLVYAGKKSRCLDSYLVLYRLKCLLAYRELD